MKATIALALFLYVTILTGQDYQVYRLYTIDAFVKYHFKDSMTFYKAFYEIAKYPAIARENHWEGVMDVMMINQSDSSFEVYVTNNQEKLFKENIYETLLGTRKYWLNKDIPFIVNFCIDYRLDQFRKTQKDSFPPCKIQLDAYSVDWRDTNYIYPDYQVSYLPQILDYPTFLRYPKSMHYQPLESLEDLMEIVVKSCCNKSLQLTHLETRKSYRKSRYIETNDVIGVIFNSHGYISYVKLFGRLTKTIDEEALSKELKSLRFHPALVNNKPVNVSVDFRVE